MTLDEAIKVLDDMKVKIHVPKSAETQHKKNEALDLAIKVLEQQPSERMEECTETHECDCISRKLMHDMGATCIAARDENGDLVALGALDILPSVNLQPKTGHWTHDGGYWKNRWICSECGYKLYDEQSKYCPNCGARMEG